MSADWAAQLAQLGNQIFGFLTTAIATLLDTLGPWLPTLIIVGIIGFLFYRFRDVIGGVIDTLFGWLG